MRGRGLTLLELVVALGLLVVLLLAFASALLLGVAQDALAAERSAATARAMSALEAVLAEPWAAQPAHDGEVFDVEVATQSGTHRLVPTGGDAHTGRTRVEDLPTPNLRRLAVSVRWRSRAGGDIELELATWAAKH